MNFYNLLFIKFFDHNIEDYINLADINICGQMEKVSKQYDKLIEMINDIEDRLDVVQRHINFLFLELISLRNVIEKERYHYDPYKKPTFKPIVDRSEKWKK